MVSAVETGPRYPAHMKTTDDTPVPPPQGRAERPAMFSHLLMGPDARTPEEQRQAESKERARRTGKGRKGWWEA